MAETVLARQSDHVPKGRHAVKRIDPPAIGPVGPVRHVARPIARRFLERAAVEIDDEPALPRIVVEDPPGQRVVALAHAEETAERHDGVGNLPGGFIDHEIVHRTETLALAIIDGCSFNLVGGDDRGKREAAVLAPAEKPVARPKVCTPGVRIADVRREKFDIAPGGFVAEIGDECDRGAQG